MIFTYRNSIVTLRISTQGLFLVKIDFLDAQTKLFDAQEPSSKEEQDFRKNIIGQLDAYFKGDCFEFDLAYLLEGTEFQLKVWDEMTRIPYGETCSYSLVAQRVGSPKAARAVGSAAHANPLPIIIPCHRIIGKDGGLVNFGGGLTLKAELLSLEQKALKRWS